MFKKQKGVVDQMETIKHFAAQKNKNCMILYEFVLFLLNAPWIISIFCMLISELFLRILFKTILT